jgi:hypothetical protein
MIGHFAPFSRVINPRPVYFSDFSKPLQKPSGVFFKLKQLAGNCKGRGDNCFKRIRTSLDLPGLF